MARSCSVLHVDDDADIGVIVRLSLALDDAMSVRSVHTAREALTALDDAAARPDLVLIDQQMPDMSGVDLVARLRAMPGGERVPVVFLTARADAATRAAIAASGAAGMLVKPFDPMTLARKVRALWEAAR